MTKSFSMAGWRVAYLVGNAEVVQALAKLKSYLDYGTFQPIQIAATVTLNEDPEHPREVQPIYQARRDVLCDGLNRIGWEIEPPKGTMFAWAPDPRAVPGDGLGRVRQLPGAGGAGGHVARRGVRARRRRPRALRAHRERAAHRPGHPKPEEGAHQARLSALADQRRPSRP
jgi:histidinol-phosphate/aromatic aminotransferase/cobyric acid decarboxylase-like protein